LVKIYLDIKFCCTFAAFLLTIINDLKKMKSKMKKVFMVFAVAAALTLAACGGGNKQENKEATQEQEVAQETVTSSKLDEYKKLIEEATPLLEKAAQGDVEATTAYAEIAQKIAAVAAEVSTEIANDPEKLKEFQDLTLKLAEEVQKIAPQEAPQQ
jgi:ABC-type glycerol-3-phosphate transport system substrate-binding protein